MGGGKQDCPHTENVIASKVALELSGNKISVYSAKPFPLLSLTVIATPLSSFVYTFKKFYAQFL